jgi:pyroglutamyl-peptidase
MATLLLTGFEPFLDYAENPTKIAIERIAEASMEGVVAAVLPVDYERARAGLLGLLREHRPRACLAMGLAAGELFRPELVAHKPPAYAELPGPARLEGAWPFGRMEGALLRAGGEVRRSTDAGRYVCNATYWALLAARAEAGEPEHAAFLHVPSVGPRWPAEAVVAVIDAVVRDTLAWLAAAGGAR